MKKLLTIAIVLGLFLALLGSSLVVSAQEGRPETESTESVEPVDSDGDGVPDDVDQCPDTPEGTEVNEAGCPVEQADERPEEPVDEPTEEPVDEPVDEPTEEPVDEPVDERPEEPVDEPVDERPEEPVDERPEEPAVEPTEEPVDEPEVKSTGDVDAAAWIEPGTGDTDVFVQNTDSVTTNDPIDVVAEYVNSSLGCPRGTCTTSKNVEPLASQEFSAVDSPVGDGWLGSMVLSSGGPAVAVAQTRWAGGDRYGAYTGFSQGSTDVYLPALYLIDNRQNSAIAVQNTTTNDGVSITINLYDTCNGSLDAVIPDTLNSGEEKYYELQDYITASSECLSGAGWWSGAAYITSATSEIAAVAITHWGGVNPSYSAMYSGFSTGQTTLYQPLQYRLQMGGGWWTYSAIVVQNPSATETAHVTLRYYNGDTGSLDLTIANEDVLPGAGRGFNTMNGGTIDASTFNPLGTWWYGAVEITSDIPVVGVGNTLWYNEEKSAQYGLAGSADGGTALYFPVQQRSGGTPMTYWSACLLKNLSTTSDASVHLYYYDRNGNLDLDFAATVLASSGGGANMMNGGSLVDESVYYVLPNNWEGSLYVTSSQPIIGAAQLIYTSDSSAYNAMIAP